MIPKVDHAIYLSVMEVVIDDKHVNIDIKVFSDDLSDVLRNYKEEEDIPLTRNQLVESYMNDKISILSKGNKCILNIKENQVVGDSNVMKFTAKLSDGVDINLQAAYFMELFPTQQNIVKLMLNGTQHYKIIKSPDQIESF